MNTDWYKYLCNALHDPQYNGKRVRRLFGRMYDLGTLSGRWGLAGEIIKYIDVLSVKQWENIVKEVTILTGINVDECLFSSSLRKTFGADNVKVIDEQDDHMIRCKDCCKWHTVACPMAENVESLLTVSAMFGDEKIVEYALSRYCSEAEQEDK